MTGGVFFLQSEDGIRELVRSRGLGDVYKRQGLARAMNTAGKEEDALGRRRLTGVNMSDDADVPDPIEADHARAGALGYGVGAAHRRVFVSLVGAALRRNGVILVKRFPVNATTSGSARRPCWLPPSDACLRDA